jgi:hypothetical protein
VLLAEQEPVVFAYRGKAMRIPTSESQNVGRGDRNTGAAKHSAKCPTRPRCLLALPVHLLWVVHFDSSVSRKKAVS